MFFTGIIPGLVALFVRFKMKESEVWLEKVRQKKIERATLRKVMLNVEHRKRFFLSLMIMTGLMYAYYTSIGFMPTFLQQYDHLERPEVATYDCRYSFIPARTYFYWLYQLVHR